MLPACPKKDWAELYPDAAPSALALLIREFEVPTDPSTLFDSRHLPLDRVWGGDEPAVGELRHGSAARARVPRAAGRAQHGQGGGAHGGARGTAGHYDKAKKA